MGISGLKANLQAQNSRTDQAKVTRREASPQSATPPGRSESAWTDVKSRPCDPDLSVHVSDLKLSDKAQSQQRSSSSQKRRCEDVIQSPKRTRHRRSSSSPVKSDQSHAAHNSATMNDSDVPDDDASMVYEPQTRPITLAQLIDEVKGIYAGLVMVEKKCVEITQQRAQSATKLADDQWQALTALHRTLLHEHHDFFLASQHPTASPALKKLANKYAMPARMWRHGIHSFLELLRQQLPDSLDHMLAFVYIAYSMMALLKESVPSFLETWIECLGDLARYRMAIEDSDLRDRETWSNVARSWYNQAADRSPNVGRIQHHLAVLARPNIVQQLFFYTKALVSVVPFVNARDSIMLLFTPVLDKQGSHDKRYEVTDVSVVIGCGYLFTRGAMDLHRKHAQTFVDTLSTHMQKEKARWKVQGPEVAASLIAAVMDVGKDENPIWTFYQEYSTTVKNRRTLPDNSDPAALDEEWIQIRDAYSKEFWTNEELATCRRSPLAVGDNLTIDSSPTVTILALALLNSAVQINARKIGDRNIIPFMCFVLSFLLSVSYVGQPMVYIESHIPWCSIVTFLNTINRSGVDDARIESETFPLATSGTGRQLPEDFLARGCIWAQHVFPGTFFLQNVTDEDERSLELPSHAAPRSERCLWLGIRLASFGRHLHYDKTTKQFSVTPFASELEAAFPKDSLPGLSEHGVASKDTLATQPPHKVQPGTTDTRSLAAQSAETDSEYMIVDDTPLSGRRNVKMEEA